MSDANLYKVWKEGKVFKGFPASAGSQNVTLLLIGVTCSHTSRVRVDGRLAVERQEGRWDGAARAIQGMLCDLHDLACL